MKNRRHGFTLVELLAVVVCVSILAALLLAGVRRVLERSRDMACLSNLREIGLAANLFASENDNFYPSAYDSSVKTDYLGYLQPYLPQNLSSPKHIYICPGNKKRTVVEYSTYRGTYGINNILSHYMSKSGVSRLQVIRPAEVILFADTCQSYSSGGGEVSFYNPTQMTSTTAPLSTVYSTGPDSDTSSGNGWMRYRHNGGVNVVMVDGHCENLKKGTVTLANLSPLHP
jgi:prepilin-type processing-associated H-X9-DG protein/prepilin-type N-terminal cleavage/methylation domain-containing protein